MNTEGNYLKPSLRGSGPSATLWYDVTYTFRETQSFFEEAVRAAKAIHSENPKIVLPMSGGIDSEAMAEAFRAASVPFSVIIFDYKGGFNKSDIISAYKYCRKHSIPHSTITIDLDDFFKHELHLQIAQDFGCRSPQIAVHLHAIRDVEGCVVFPYNPLALYKNRDDKFWWCFPSYLHLSYDRFFTKAGRSGVGLFFLYSRELLYSAVAQSVYRDMMVPGIGFGSIYSTNAYIVKTRLYELGGFRIWPRVNKATGFEDYRRHLNKLHPNPDGSDFFDLNYRRPMESLSQDFGLRGMGSVSLEYLHERWFPQTP